MTWKPGSEQDRVVIKEMCPPGVPGTLQHESGTANPAGAAPRLTKGVSPWPLDVT